MTKKLICYADSNMKTSQRLCTLSAEKKGGVDYSIVADEDFIDEHFSGLNAKILNEVQRGGGKGYWLFKPYLCEKAVRSSNDGDIVIYADSGIEFIAPVDPIVSLMEHKGESIFLFGNGHEHAHWTKGDVLAHMLPGSNWDNLGEQVQASVIFFRVNDYTREFCRRWLAWSQIPGFIDDSPSKIPNHPQFKDHRNDQSILTCLAIQDKLKLHWWPVQYGHYIKDKYPRDVWYRQSFYHHRYRESDWEKCGLTIKQFMQQYKNS